MDRYGIKKINETIDFSHTINSFSYIDNGKIVTRFSVRNG